MKKLRIWLVFTLLCSLVQAEAGQPYFKVGTGASFSEKTDIYASPVFWDPSPQGYNADMGCLPILTGGLGYEFCDLFSADITLSYRPNFHYKKFQTSTSTETPGFLGITTRNFNLDISTLMFSMYLSGVSFQNLTWEIPCCCSAIYPIIGAGIGVNELLITNFRSTGLPPVSEADPFPAFSSDNAYFKSYHFTYQIMAGLEFRFMDCWAISAGYRWFDAGKFNGPEYVRDQTGIALEGIPWKIRFKANEFFFEFKYFFM
jgi:opacity protein-like surface antigen